MENEENIDEQSRQVITNLAEKNKKGFLSSWFSIKTTKGKLGLFSLLFSCFLLAIIFMLSFGALAAIVVVVEEATRAQGDVTDTMPIN